jgi:polysaccharide deacetylase 2 family uncharacterized protein YibQ
MGPAKNNKNGAPWPVMVIWVLVAVVCIQGYLLFTKKPVVVRPKPPITRPVVKLPAATKVIGKIAVVLDDWGYNSYHCKYLQNIDAPVTAAILPNLPFSKQVLACARAAGQEAILHLPLEPYANNDKYPRDYILTTKMSSKELTVLLKKILDEFPGISGVNNHMGSKATEDPRVMTIVMTEIKKRGLFFVDSVTSSRSVCPQVAQEIKIPFARRVVFLDNRNERVSIERSFAEGARIAREKGFALIIGHDRELTLKILAEQITKLKQQGYQFLSVKDLIKAEKE